MPKNAVRKLTNSHLKSLIELTDYELAIKEGMHINWLKADLKHSQTPCDHIIACLITLLMLTYIFPKVIKMVIS